MVENSINQESQFFADEFQEAFENEEEIKNRRENILIDEDLDNYSNASRSSDLPQFDNLIVNDRKKLKSSQEINPIFSGIKASENRFIFKPKQSPYIEQSYLKNFQKNNESFISENKENQSDYTNKPVSKELKFDSNFFRRNLKTIYCKHSKINTRNFEVLFEVQSIEIEPNSPIWVMKTSLEGKFIAIGGKSGVLRIYEIFQNEGVQMNINPGFVLGNLNEFNSQISKKTHNSNVTVPEASNSQFSVLKLFNENPYRVFKEHSEDIIDICWGIGSKINILLTASLDGNVILWDVNKENFQAKYEHSNMVTSLSFCPNNDEVFVSGSLDKIIRIWNIHRKKVIDYINTQDYITAITYSPTGNNIFVGFHNGKCSNFEVNNKLKYNSTFECKNKFGKYSKGTKITALEFINKNELLVTSGDSRIRLLNDNKLLQKYKGHKNDEIMIRSFFEENNQIIISASDDGNVYVWRKYVNQVPSVNQSYNPFSNEHLKNNSYEYFRPFERDIPTSAFFANEFVLHSYQKKFFLNKVLVKSVILISSQHGKMSVLIDPIFLEENDGKL